MWDYRIFQQDTPHSAEGKYLFFIGECYYDDDVGKPELHSLMDYNIVSADDEKELRQTYELIGHALAQPVIELDVNGDFKNRDSGRESPRPQSYAPA
jgi:hypothetical protein